MIRNHATFSLEIAHFSTSFLDGVGVLQRDDATHARMLGGVLCRRRPGNNTCMLVCLYNFVCRTSCVTLLLPLPSVASFLSRLLTLPSPLA